MDIENHGETQQKVAAEDLQNVSNWILQTALTWNKELNYNGCVHLSKDDCSQEETKQM